MALTVISPTILSKDPNEFKDTVKEYYKFAKRVHIDISDGSLTNAVTIQPPTVWWPKGWITDIHLISAEPSKHLDTLIKLSPNLVIFHAEAREDLKPIFEKLKEHHIRVGVAIVKSIYPGNIKSLLQSADHALIFCGNLGEYGGSADLLQLEKVEIIKNINQNLEIGWDGGANRENIHLINHGDVDVINVGSAIAQAENPASAFSELDQLLESEQIL